jgi:FMN phosphatase YigB (HAD superfamily)
LTSNTSNGSRIRAVAFDLWETLITDTPELLRRQERLRLERIESILIGRGFVAAATRLEAGYRSVWRRCHALYWSDDLDITCRRQVEHFLEELELDPRSFSPQVLDEIERAYALAAVDILPRTVEGAGNLLQAVKARGLATGLISNTGRTPGYALRSVLEALGLAGSLDVMVFSNEHGACKPQRSIFEELRGALEVSYEEMVFVGDNLYVDVHGAQQCGMRAIHFDPPQRGTAVAPPVDHGLSIVPDARITSLHELPEVLDRLGVPG